MKTALAASLDRNRKFLPLGATIALFLLVYLVGVFSFPAMRDGQAFFNLFDAAPFLIVTVVGESFVIISGGIDLSVSGILALTTVVAASLLQMGWSAVDDLPGRPADGDAVRVGDGSVHHLPEGAALHRDAGRHVAGSRPVATSSATPKSGSTTRRTPRWARRRS